MMDSIMMSDPERLGALVDFPSQCRGTCLRARALCRGDDLSRAPAVPCTGCRVDVEPAVRGQRSDQPRPTAGVAFHMLDDDGRLITHYRTIPAPEKTPVVMHEGKIPLWRSPGEVFSALAGFWASRLRRIHVQARSTPRILLPSRSGSSGTYGGRFHRNVPGVRSEMHDGGGFRGSRRLRSQQAPDDDRGSPNCA